MKSFSFFFLLFLIGVSSLFTACNSCSSGSNKPSQTVFESQLVSKDTAEVEHVVQQFFYNIQHKKFYDAAAMLYIRKDTAASPRQYTNEEMDKFVAMYKGLPFEGYKIDYMKFSSSTFNEVSCTLILRKGQNGKSDAVTKVFFCPVMIGGKWGLILTDSQKFEHTVTEFDQRDSLKERYDNYKKTHK